MGSSCSRPRERPKEKVAAAWIDSGGWRSAHRAASASWRGQRAASAAYLAPQQASLDTRLTDRVRISSTPKVSTVARQGVSFPITIRNDLPAEGDGGTDDPAAIRVRLVFESDNSRRLMIKPVSPEPGGVLGELLLPLPLLAAAAARRLGAGPPVATAAAEAGAELIYSGGVGTLEHLRELAALRVPALAGVIVGRALYEGRFTVAEGQAALS